MHENSISAIDQGTRELVESVLSANNLAAGDVISILFTMSPDLNAAFPAASARALGFASVPLICAVEIDVPGALARTIRLLAHVQTSAKPEDISHIYLHGAKALRADIAQ